MYEYKINGYKIVTVRCRRTGRLQKLSLIRDDEFLHSTSFLVLALYGNHTVQFFRLRFLFLHFPLVVARLDHSRRRP